MHAEEGEDEPCLAPLGLQGANQTVQRWDSLGFAVPAAGSADSAHFNAVRQYADSFWQKGQRRLRRLEKSRTRCTAQSTSLDGMAGEQVQWSTLPPKQLKKLLRKGLPAKYRKEVWWSILGCEETRARSSASFAELSSQPLAEDVAATIDHDLARSFPRHQKFQGGSESAPTDGQQQLRLVLCAFATHWPHVRYCQGLNFIAGLLLIVFDDAERAFWALSCAMDRLSIEGYYVEGMALLRADVLVLENLLSQKCPTVARNLRNAGVDLAYVCSEWFLTWFAKSLPHATTLRVWDCLFHEGFKILFRVAVAIFKRVEADVLSCSGDFDALMQQGKGWAKKQVEHNELLKTAFNLEPFRRADLLLLRFSSLQRVKLEDDARRPQLAAKQRAVQDTSL
mmetsp:Transcript_11988/g.21971  ORF Transcript_11988/g.21971 Transcript_11988/m.21971 type:complete len:395 (+) Transcript_11988:42-1226(+)